MRKGWQTKEEGVLLVVSFAVVAVILNFTSSLPINNVLGVSLAISLAITAVEVLADIYLRKG